MVNGRLVNGFVWSPTMLMGISPKISYYCGNCRHHNTTRLSVAALKRRMAYACCELCGETNDLRLHI